MASQEWEKPKAVVIPKETGQLPKGKYGPIYPRTPACYGFTIIAKVKPGTAETIRNYGNNLAKALEGVGGEFLESCGDRRLIQTATVLPPLV